MEEFIRRAKLLGFLLIATSVLFATACSTDEGSSGGSSPETYTVTFETNGGSVIEALSIEDGKKIEKPADPTKEGFTFAGWYSDEALESAWDFETAVKKDIKLYAKWDENKKEDKTVKIVISFETNEGSSIDNLAFDAGKTAEAPKAPEKTGFDFAGWFKDSELTQEFNFESDSAKLTENIKLYAKWVTKVLTVKFETNGGSELDSVKVNYGEKVAKPAKNPTKANSTFEGWYVDEEFSKEFDFAETEIKESITIYAKWAVVKGSFEVKFETNSSSKTSSQAVIEGEKATEPETPIKEHYTFAGWYSDDKLSAKFSFDTAITGNITLYAKWNPVKYTVTFNTNGGNTITAQPVEYKTKAIKPAAPKKEHYTFENWYSDQELSHEFSFDTEISGDTTLYAKWTPVKYTVTFETNGGSPINAAEVDYNSTVEKPDAPTKDDRVFDAWYTDEALTKAYDFTKPVTGDLILYAKYIPFFMVTFDSKGGSEVNPAKVGSGKTVTAPAAPTKAKSIFAGWYTSKDKGVTLSETAWDFSKNTVTDEITLYAKWIEAWTVTFNANNGSEEKSVDVEKGKTVKKPADPKKDNYTFEGWYTDKACKKNFDFTTAITGDLTLYAKWKPVNYTVTFESNGGSAVKAQIVPYGSKASKPVPDKADKDFEGWYTDKACTKKFDFTTAITGNLTLYAKWTIGYTVTFNTDGGSKVEKQLVEVNQKATKPADPTKEGYAFEYWYEPLKGENTKFDFDTAITGSKSLSAKWTPAYTVTFDTNGGSKIPAQTIKIGGKATKPADPERGEGESKRTFINWYTENGSEFDFENSEINDNITLYAKWKLPEEIANAVSVSVIMSDIEVKQIVDKDSIVFEAPVKGEWYVDKYFEVNNTEYIFNKSEYVPGVYTLNFKCKINNNTYSWTAQIEVK